MCYRKDFQTAEKCILYGAKKIQHFLNQTSEFNINQTSEWERIKYFSLKIGNGTDYLGHTL